MCGNRGYNAITTGWGRKNAVVRELTEAYLLPERELDVVKTFECGQCFRWRPGEDGVYRGVAGGRAARVYPRGGDVYIEAEERDLPFWREYFDLGTDYAAARESVEVCDYIRECAAYGEGIRILRQDKWEALCSFIISQCNNIPRIRGIVERLCGLFGEEVDAPWGCVRLPGAGGARAAERGRPCRCAPATARNI